MEKLFKKMTTKTARSWTEWIFPKQDSYLMKCCDCGLVHELQFKAFVEKNQKRGAFEVVPLPEPIRAMFRARRFIAPKSLKGIVLKRKPTPPNP